MLTLLNSIDVLFDLNSVEYRTAVVFQHVAMFVKIQSTSIFICNQSTIKTVTFEFLCVNFTCHMRNVMQMSMLNDLGKNMCHSKAEFNHF